MLPLYPPADPSDRAYQALCRNLGGEVAFHQTGNAILAKDAAATPCQSGRGMNFWGLRDPQGTGAMQVKPVVIHRVLKDGDHFSGCSEWEFGKIDGGCICDVGEDLFADTNERRVPQPAEAWLNGMTGERKLERGPRQDCGIGLHPEHTHIILQPAQWARRIP